MALLALLAGLATLLFLLLRDKTPLLTAASLEKARAAWRQNELPDYNITLLKETDVRAPERDITEVRGKKATLLLIDGNPVPVRDSYSILGLFDLMDRELEMASSKAPAAGQPEGALLKAAFHPRLGFPLVFKRIASKRQSVVITVEKLEIRGGEVVYPSHK